MTNESDVSLILNELFEKFYGSLVKEVKEIVNNKEYEIAVVGRSIRIYIPNTAVFSEFNGIKQELKLKGYCVKIVDFGYIVWKPQEF